jgi:hypothetical protein
MYVCNWVPLCKFTERVTVEVMVLIAFERRSTRIVVRITIVLTKDFSWLSLPSPGEYRNTIMVWSRYLPSKLLSIHYSYINLKLDTVNSIYWQCCKIPDHLMDMFEYS